MLLACHTRHTSPVIWDMNKILIFLFSCWKYCTEMNYAMKKSKQRFKIQQMANQICNDTYERFQFLSVEVRKMSH